MNDKVLIPLDLIKDEILWLADQKVTKRDNVIYLIMTIKKLFEFIEVAGFIVSIYYNSQYSSYLVKTLEKR